MNRSRVSVVMALVAALGLVSVASANLLSNGGFESATPLEGWTNVGNPSDAAVFVGGEHGLVPFPMEGAQAAGWVSGWDTSRNGAVLYQQFAQPAATPLTFSVNALAATNYQTPLPSMLNNYDSGVDFYYDPNGGTNWQAAGVVWLAGVWNQDTHADFLGGGDGWVNHVAQTNSGGATGTIFAVNRHNWGLWNMTFVDDLSVTPEPASALLLLVGIGLIRRRRA